MSQNYDPYHLKSPTIYLVKNVVFLVIVLDGVFELKLTGTYSPRGLSELFGSLSATPQAVPVSPLLAQLVERGLVESVRQVRRTLALTEAGRKVAAALKPEDVAGSEVAAATRIAPTQAPPDRAAGRSPSCVI